MAGKTKGESPLSGKWAYAAGAAAILAFIALLYALSPSQVRFSESSTNVTWAPPSLAAGDAINYSASAQGTAWNVTVKSLGWSAEWGCFLLSEDSGGNISISACYAQNGSLARAFAGDRQIPAEAFANGLSVAGFEPWMASAAPGWTATSTLTRSMEPRIALAEGVRDESVTTYAYNGTEKIAGRDAYRIEIETGKAVSGYGFSRTSRRTVWVDAQRKIALKEDGEAGGEEYHLMVQSAPFLGIR
jgi:hypothetical protein